MCPRSDGRGYNDGAPQSGKCLRRRRQRGSSEEIFPLFESGAVRIERIVSRSHSSPPGFWYDQPEDEWAMVLRGSAVLEFADGEIVEMKEGDYLLIPRHVRHRIARTGKHTVWLAVHLK
jgi:cupin 2 domain-containing protein